MPFKPIDSDIFSICLVPIQLVNKKDYNFVWHNKKSYSPRFCRPIKISFTTETAEHTKKDLLEVETQIADLVSTIIPASEGPSNFKIDYNLKKNYGGWEGT